MKIERIDGSEVRRILTALIVDKAVLAKIAPRWQGEMFMAHWANLVGDWCADFYKRFQDAPKKSIVGCFEKWSRKADKDTVQLVEKFLGQLSGEYEAEAQASNSDYIVDLASKHFTRVRLTRLAEKIQGDVDADDVGEASKAVEAFSAVEVGTGASISPLNDMEVVRTTFETNESEALVQFPDALGEFFGDQLARDSFVVFMGPEKRGKCVAGDTEVLLADGRVDTIAEIVRRKDPAERVVSLDEKTGQFIAQPVGQFWDNGEKVCYEVRTRSGRKVSTTGNHQYLTPSGWKYLDDIRLGEFIAVPKRVPFFGRLSMPSEELRFLAYMAAEGCCVQAYFQGKKNGTASTFTNADPATQADFERCCLVLGVGFVKKGIEYHLRDALPLLRLHGLAGHSAKTKTIPPRVFQLNRDQVAEFIRVFFTCDGTIYEDRGAKKIELTLANEKLVRQFSHLLSRFGVVGRVSYEPSSFEGRVFPAWRISIASEEYVNLFVQEINFDSYKKTPAEAVVPSRSFLDRIPYEVVRRVWESVKSRGCGVAGVFGKQTGHIREQLRLRQPMMRKSFVGIDDAEVRMMLDTSVLWDAVTEIRSLGLRPTYDLGVETHHNFVAGDCVVHNTWWLLETAYRALLQQRKVAFFEAGDMSEKQLNRRLYTRVARRPLRPKTVRIPKAMVRGDDEKQPRIKFESKTFDHGLDWREAWKACEALRKDKLRTDQDLLKVVVHPNDTLSLPMIDEQLEAWARDGWTADVIVIDYMDLIVATGGGDDFRHQTNATWKQGRGLSQKWHALVVSATQSDADSYTKNVITRSNFSEDKRKLAHVTDLVGLNQTDTEKELGLMRLNHIVLREAAYSATRCVFVAGCPDLGCLAIKSCW